MLAPIFWALLRGTQQSHVRRIIFHWTLPRCLISMISLPAIGFHDSLGFFPVFKLWSTSLKIRKAINKSIMLNGVIFLGSMLLMTALRHLISRFFFPDTTLDVFNDAESLLSWILMVLWIAPLYLVTFIFSAPAYNTCAAHTYMLSRLDVPIPLASDADDAVGSGSGLLNGTDHVSGGGGVWQFFVNSAEEVYRMLLVLAGLAGLFVCSAFLGSLDWVLTLLGSALLYGFYVFEYRWALEGMPTSVRFEILETRWPYFIGFGLPLSISSVVFARDYFSIGPALVAAAETSGSPVVQAALTAVREMVAGTFSVFLGTGIFAVIFPFYVILAVLAKPPQEISTFVVAPAAVSPVAGAGAGAGSAGAPAALARVSIPRLPVVTLLRFVADKLLTALVWALQRCCGGCGGTKKKKKRAAGSGKSDGAGGAGAGGDDGKDDATPATAT